MGLMTVAHSRKWPSRYPGAAKAMDIFGKDTTTLVLVTVG